MGHRRAVPFARRAGSRLPEPAAPRHDDVRQPRRAAVPRPGSRGASGDHPRDRQLDPHAAEGTRVKHAINRNSIKMYDKQQSVLRVETTINNPRDMKVYRVKETAPAGPKEWLRLRKGVADLHRRAEVSQKSNERYLETLAAVEHDEPLGETVRPICQPTAWHGRRVRALQPLSPDDSRLLAAVVRGEFALNGFRNRDLRPLLFGDGAVSPDEARRQSSKITRLLRLLRGHGLIQKVPKTHRYTLTDPGRQTITALQIAQQTSTQQLAKLAV